jgi:ribose transport system ATP-binding protein
VAQGIAYLSEDRKHFGLVTGMSVATTSADQRCWRRNLSGGLFMRMTRWAEVAEDYVRKLKVKTRISTGNPAAVGRQPRRW